MNNRIYTTSAITTDFEVCDCPVLKDRFLPVPPNILLISDFRWWMDNADDIEPWMDANLKTCKRNGMVLEFADEQEYMLFILRWQ